MAGLGFSSILEKLITKIRSEQFVDMADLPGDNLKALELEPQNGISDVLVDTN